MDPILERFNRLIKSMFVDTDDIDFGYDEFSGNPDTDFADAWEELNDFLSTPGWSAADNRNHTKTTYDIPPPPEMLRPDYLNMGVPFGTDFNITKKAYKQLITKYHPDKNSATPEALHKATERSKNLNISYQKIKAWELAKRG